MKTIHFLRTHFLLMAAILTAGITMSFKMTEKTTADSIYTYNSDKVTEGSFANTANWMVVSSAPSCQSTGNRPCNIVVPAGQTLASQIAGLNNSQVLAINPTERKP
ncbi:hypothetical protein KSK37_12215 [Kaistella sp. DKR-2]|uniref:hypothetical protein n=1 Tax=Kaistella soli TaxID=2849654 RepID=UPI001C25AB9A|nr:hypothetical protein [Kaistella soli]MBU8883851.1 hypothetical protein [Kaistella soli]